MRVAPVIGIPKAVLQEEQSRFVSQIEQAHRHVALVHQLSVPAIISKADLYVVAEGAEIGNRGGDCTRRLVHNRDLAADHSEVRKHGAT